MNFLIVYKIAFVFVINLLDFNFAKSLQKIRTHIDVCGPISETHLTEDGEGSSLTVHLKESKNSNVCTLIVKAPNVVNVQLIESYPKLIKNETMISDRKRPKCLLDVYLPDERKTAIWKGDLCGDESLLDIGLLPNNIHLVWRPPVNEKHVKERKLVLTAVGQGDTCQRAGHHACLTVGWNPLLCISEHLLCDGIVHCPKNSMHSDEDATLCGNYRNQWQQFADSLIKNFQRNNLLNIKWIQDKMINDTDPNELKNEYIDLLSFNGSSNADKNGTKRHKPDSVAYVLSQYSPWSYIMLGVLMCAVLLFFCGLWECCFRVVKEDAENQSAPSAENAAQPSSMQINDNQPPNYYELDQPPSYNALFPNVKNDVTHAAEGGNVNNLCVLSVDELMPSSADVAVTTAESTNRC